ncbi:hypothetical protein CHS0354_006758 [Potamilus streckersoni]|uniref:Uncharacterized protein n=1 Tax=Potamilus streckersoni TaxID=2493646 RepID=A0AAE0S8D3_9BIVA|nr:hypothetical protein CHS0354_006758 [Potamilus streckersoni]
MFAIKLHRTCFDKIVILLPLFFSGFRGYRRNQTEAALKGDDVEVDNNNDADASNEIDAYGNVFARAETAK